MYGSINIIKAYEEFKCLIDANTFCIQENREEYEFLVPCSNWEVQLEQDNFKNPGKLSAYIKVIIMPCIYFTSSTKGNCIYCFIRGHRAAN